MTELELLEIKNKLENLELFIKYMKEFLLELEKKELKGEENENKILD